MCEKGTAYWRGGNSGWFRELYAGRNQDKYAELLYMDNSSSIDELSEAIKAMLDSSLLTEKEETSNTE